MDFQVDISVLGDASAAVYSTIFDLQDLSRTFFTGNQGLLETALKGQAAQSYGNNNQQWQVTFNDLIDNLKTLHNTLSNALAHVDESSTQAGGLAAKIGGVASHSQAKTLALSRSAKDAACKMCQSMINNYTTYLDTCQKISRQRAGRSRYATSTMVDSALSAARREVEDKQDQLRALINALNTYESGITVIENIMKALPSALKRPQGWSAALSQIASDPSLQKILQGWGFGTAVAVGMAAAVVVSKVADDSEIQAKVSEYLSTTDPVKQKEILAWLDSQPKAPDCPYVQPWQLEILKWKDVTLGMVQDLNRTLTKYKITTPQEIAMFLATATVESKTGLIENINKLGNNYHYSSYKGNEVSYRGGGYLQLTGYNNYSDFAGQMAKDGLVTIAANGSNPIMVGGAKYVADNFAWESAGWYWSTDRNLNTKVNDGMSFYQVTQLINIGHIDPIQVPNGWKDRADAYDQVTQIYGNSYNLK